MLSFNNPCVNLNISHLYRAMLVGENVNTLNFLAEIFLFSVRHYNQLVIFLIMFMSIQLIHRIILSGV